MFIGSSRASEMFVLRVIDDLTIAMNYRNCTNTIHSRASQKVFIHRDYYCLPSFNYHPLAIFGPCERSTLMLGKRTTDQNRMVVFIHTHFYFLLFTTNFRHKDLLFLIYDRTSFMYTRFGYFFFKQNQKLDPEIFKSFSDRRWMEFVFPQKFERRIKDNS